MSHRVPLLYHWSPVEARAGILRRGLVPRTPSAIAQRPWRPGENVGHHVLDEAADSLLAVCLGTSPRTAWAYSAAFARPGDVFDLWEVWIHEDDEVHYRPTFGDLLDEVRVANRIPKSRVWHVGTRTRGRHAM